TDISKITRKQSKTGKHGHENQKNTKRSQRIKAEARKVKPQSNPVKEKSIFGQQKSTRPTIFHFSPQSFTKIQVSLKRIATLAIRVRSLIDPTAKIFDPMIGK
ncbi:hypothetical protein Tco_1116520, partial [Tanacetum coccineum]